MGEVLHFAGQPIGPERLDRFEDARVKRAPPALEEALVGDLLGRARA